MANIAYRKFKVKLAADSRVTQGLKFGDVVLRQYFDAPNLFYTLMYVLETGEDTVIIDGENKTQKWFIGALIDGDEPRTGEVLDFARITSLNDDDRMGAVYITAVDDESPYIDVIDKIGSEQALNFPTRIGEPTAISKHLFSVYPSTTTIAGIFKDPDVTRTFRAGRISLSPSDTRILIPTLRGKNYDDDEFLIVYQAQASRAGSFTVSVANQDGSRSLFNETIDVGVNWKTFLHKFRVSDIHTDSYFQIDLSGLELNHSLEIGEFSIIPVKALSHWSQATKARFGKLTGIHDDVFGTLKDYGGYFQRLYATKDVNVAGTLTAGDANGFASTFYAGRISKNKAVNSLGYDFGTSAVVTADVSPVGIGDVWQNTSSPANYDFNTSTWLSDNVGKEITFSVYMKGLVGGEIVNVSIGNKPATEAPVTLTTEWVRYSFTEVINNMPIPRIVLQSSGNFLFSAPQVELGTKATLYQPTDEVLTEDSDFGAWMNRGGVGGTIQNPLLRFDASGNIIGRNGNFRINADGTAYFKGHLEAGSGTIGGWNIDSDAIYFGTKKNTIGTFTDDVDDITMGTQGLRGKFWRLDVDGSGAVGGGGLKWDSAGNLIFDDTSITFTGDSALGKRLTYIDGNGIYTGTLTAEQVTAVNANFKTGTIGGWTINANQIVGGNTILNSNGSISGQGWSLNNDGTGSLAGGNISWLADGTLTINSALNATGGKIGGWNIDGNSIYSGAKQPNNAFTTAAGAMTISSTGAIRARYFRVDTDGKMYATGAEISGTLSCVVGATTKWILRPDGSGFLASGKISWDVIGNLSYEGKLITSEGTIGGWTITDNAIYTGTSFPPTANGFTTSNAMIIGNAGVIRARYFKVEADGKMTASDGTFTGSVTATSGTIGGWYIRNSGSQYQLSTLSSWTGITNTFLSSGMTIGVNSSGQGYINSVNFRVEPNGNMYARNANISGTITASAGRIGNWYIKENSIQSQETITLDGLSFTTAGITLNSNGSIQAPNFRLSSGGNAYFRGYIEASSGLIGGFNITADRIWTGSNTQGNQFGSGLTITASGAIRAEFFRVDSDGKMYATSGEFSGKITADSGNIGGFLISSSGLSINNTGTEFELNTTSLGFLMLYNKTQRHRAQLCGLNIQTVGASSNVSLSSWIINNNNYGAYNVGMYISVTHDGVLGQNDFCIVGDGNMIVSGSIAAGGTNWLGNGQTSAIYNSSGNFLQTVNVCMPGSSTGSVYILPTLQKLSNRWLMTAYTPFSMQYTIVNDGSNPITILSTYNQYPGGSELSPIIRGNNVLPGGRTAYIILAYTTLGYYNAYITIGN